MNGVDLVGVVDTDETRRNDITEIWGGTPFDTVQSLIDAGVDAVTIATPTTHHREAAEQLLEAGVACLIEKPLAATEVDANAIAHAAETAERRPAGRSRCSLRPGDAGDRRTRRTASTTP